jgi:hypothetical protein
MVAKKNALHGQVYQACYGVLKVPKGPWMCRICKFTVTNPVRKFGCYSIISLYFYRYVELYDEVGNGRIMMSVDVGGAETG